MQNTIRFKLDGIHNRTKRDWFFAKTRSDGTSEGAARSHAKEHGAAGMWCANDSFVLFYRDNGRIRQRTWRQGRPL